MEIKRGIYLDKLIRKKKKRPDKSDNRCEKVWEVLSALLFVP